MAEVKRATDTAFDLLHALFVDSMTEELGREIEAARQPKFLADEKGELTLPNPAYAPLSSKLLGVIRATLKDNGIDVPASSPRFSGLVDKLKNLDIDETAPERFQ